MRPFAIMLMTAVLVLAGYETVLRLWHPPADTGQDQFAGNIIRLENYADSGRVFDGVVTGSSLTARIVPDAWPQGWQVLSVAGGNALTGVAVVARSTPLPRRVLVEINTLDTDWDADPAEAATGAWQRTARRMVWFLRTADRPANLLAWVLHGHATASQDAPAPDFADLLARQQRMYRAGAAPALETNLAKLQPLVGVLTKAGVRVAFVEMPTDASLVQTRRAAEIRRHVAALFPPSAYCWITPAPGPWGTVDGIHLLGPDGRRAAALIAAAPCLNAGKHP